MLYIWLGVGLLFLILGGAGIAACIGAGMAEETLSKLYEFDDDGE